MRPSPCDHRQTASTTNHRLDVISHFSFVNQTARCAALFVLSCICATACSSKARADEPAASEDPLVTQASTAILQAADAFAGTASTRGGYVYQVSLDGKLRFGEGKATETEIWVQPPGTPTVGLAMLRAYRATGDERLLKHATAAADALMFG